MKVFLSCLIMFLCCSVQVRCSECDHPRTQRCPAAEPAGVDEVRREQREEARHADSRRRRRVQVRVEEMAAVLLRLRRERGLPLQQWHHEVCCHAYDAPFPLDRRRPMMSEQKILNLGALI